VGLRLIPDRRVQGGRDVVEGKKRWRAHVAKVKALPPGYRIVYREPGERRKR
jgi:DNA-binding ferritin-like protein (Dps family)